MTENPRYRVWMQTHDGDGLNEPTAGPWLSRSVADTIRGAMFKQPAVVRTWIEKEGVPAKFVDETPFIVGLPPEPEPPKPTYAQMYEDVRRRVEAGENFDLPNAANDFVKVSPGLFYLKNTVDVTHAPRRKTKRRKPKPHTRTKPRKKAAR